MRRFVGLLWVVLFAACGSHESEPHPERHVPHPVASPDTHTDPAAPPASGEGATAGEGDGVAIHGTPGESDVRLSVAVTGGAAVALAPRIHVERRDGTEWSDVHGIVELSLRPDCEHPAPECVNLVPGAELLPPSWLGTTGDAQCICTRCAPVPAGTYRFVLLTCDGTKRYLGEPFELVAR